MVAVLCATTGDALPWWFFALLTLGMVGYLVANIVVAPALDRRWRKKHPDTGAVELIGLLNSIAWHGAIAEDDTPVSY